VIPWAGIRCRKPKDVPTKTKNGEILTEETFSEEFFAALSFSTDENAPQKRAEVS
jgi:hypothetical protein